jgi:voltage-gated potassium channel Kch
MAFLFSIFRRMQSHENQGPVSVPAWLRLIAGLIVYVVFVLIGAAIIMALEKDDEFDATQANRNWNFGSSCYFMVVTTTTIGYGDFSPTTSGGRAFVAIYGLVGLGLVGVSLTVFFFFFFFVFSFIRFFFFFFSCSANFSSSFFFFFSCLPEDSSLARKT